MCRLRSHRDLAPVADACVEDVYFVPLEVLGIEDLDMPEAGADRAFSQPAKHEGEESAYQQKPANPPSHHQQGHHLAPPVAKYVTKREQQELAHDDLLPGRCRIR